MTLGYKFDQIHRAGLAEGIAKGSQEATIIAIGKSVDMLKKSNIGKTDAMGFSMNNIPTIPK